LLPRWVFAAGIAMSALAFAFALHTLAKLAFLLSLGGFLLLEGFGVLFGDGIAAGRSAFYIRALRRGLVGVLAWISALALWAADRYAISRTSRVLLQNAPWITAIKVAAPLTLFGLAVAALLPIGRAWYPPVLPNDYYEIGDTIRLLSPTGAAELSREDLLNCAAQRAEAAKRGNVTENDPACRLPIDAERYWSLIEAVDTTSQWQAEAGRVLYHHSYVLVPARHFLRYGLDGAVPYLYGYGNTLFHAALMSAAGTPTISSYFETLPLAALFGLLAIAALVTYGSRSLFAGFTAFGLGLSAYYAISFTPLVLAVSFSPLRYFGIVVQMASILFLFRGIAASRCAAIPAAIAFSFFWNIEFALLGCFGQGLALLSPRLDVSWSRRSIALGLSVAIAVIAYFAPRVSADITSSVQLGLFNIGVPIMRFAESVEFFLVAFGAQAVLAAAAFQFEPKARHARLCMLPIAGLVFIKYIYNPSPPHLLFVLVLLLPLALLYWPWTHFSRRREGGRVHEPLVSAAALVLCLWSGSALVQNAARFHELLTDDFRLSRWTALEERISIATPEAPISMRVEAIRKQLRPGEKLLLLSPFDHLLSFYVNPRALCGHFELLTNLATRADVDAVIQCVRQSANVLIAYDAAVDTPCIELLRTLQLQTSCPKKMTLKKNLSTLMEAMKPYVMPAGSSGDLYFYRTGPVTP
jgi:hypothetical protein